VAYLSMLAELREARAADRPKSLGPRYAIVPRPAATVCGESPSANFFGYTAGDSSGAQSTGIRG
jgi:hypothetical protein